MKHILLEKAFCYENPKGNNAPENCNYNFQKGYWTECNSATAMMLSSKARPRQTKKADSETGEDQKGE